MLESGDNLNVDADVDIGRMEFFHHKISTLALDSFYGLTGKKPYIVNLNKIECIVGEWNKDKTEYGLRIFFESGNSVWLGRNSAEELFKYFKATLGEHVEREAGLHYAKMDFHMAAEKN